MISNVLSGQVVIAGRAAAPALAANEPLSFWGGYDYASGEIIDRRHPLSGQVAAGRVLCLPFTRGSSTTTAVLLEAVKAGTAPAAILTTEARAKKVSTPVVMIAAGAVPALTASSNTAVVVLEPRVKGRQRMRPVARWPDSG